MKRTRCPNGSRKGKDGTCKVYIKPNKTVNQKTTKKKKASSVRKTPRSIYAKQYFANNKETIHLLDKLHKDDTSVLFQVNYNDVNQFLNYENLHNSPKIDCFFQTIFSLGLRDIKISKKSSTQVNKHGKVGVNVNEVKLFIKNAFGLSEDETVSFFINKMSDSKKHKKRSSEFISKKIRDKFDVKLKDGYATILYVQRLHENDTVGGHFMIIYKYNNQIYFFDPQKKTKKNVNGIFNSTNIRDVLIDRSGDIGYFTIDNLKSPKPLVNTTCPINYIG